MGLLFLSPLFITGVLFSNTLAYSLRAQQRTTSTTTRLPLQQVAGYKPTSNSVTAKGTVEAIATSPLMAPGHGWVREVFFADGDYVRGRQILLKFLESNSYSTEFNRNYLLAPHAGFLVKRNVAVGNRVRAGMHVAMLQDVSHVKVPLVVSSQVGRSIKVCDPVVVRVAEMPGRTFTGLVERIDRQLHPQPKTVVVVTVRNAVAPLIRPLMHASVSWSARQLPASVAKR